jgi:hypothetical protein
MKEKKIPLIINGAPYISENRGGPRPGSGRKKQEPTVRVRVPVSMVDQVRAFVEGLKKGA